MGELDEYQNADPTAYADGVPKEDTAQDGSGGYFQVSGLENVDALVDEIMTLLDPESVKFNPNHTRTGQFGTRAGGIVDPVETTERSLTKAQKPMAKNLSFDEEQSIIQWSTDRGENCIAINSILRGTAKRMSYDDRKFYTRLGDDLHDAIQKFTIPNDITVYRGTKFSLEHLKPHIGKIISDKGFPATATDESHAMDYSTDDKTLMRIHVPKGTHAVYVEVVAGKGTDGEVLLDKNPNYRLNSITEENGWSIADISLEGYAT